MNAPTTTLETCDYCGLPLPRPLFARRPAVECDRPRYCCMGCRLAAAVTQERGEAGTVGWTLTSLGLSIFFTMSVMVFTIAHWMYGVYDLQGAQSTPLSTVFGQLLQWLSLVFSAPVLLMLGKPLFEDALRGLKDRILSTDLLLLTGVLSAFVYSTVNVIRGEGPVYFEVGCVILVAVTFGRWLSATGKLRANAALGELQKLLPEIAHVRRGTAIVDMPTDQLSIGDVVLVRAGERFPIDGYIVSGTASIDEQVFTGESDPVFKGPRDPILAGTLNLDGSTLIWSTSRPGEGAFGSLVEAVKAARNAKGHYQNLADRVSAAFFPVVTILAILAFISHGLTRGWPDGLMAGLSVVLIACPCALALATPLAVWASLGRAARKGILFKSGEALERLAAVTAIRFDKTGTITTGMPRLAGMHIATDASSTDVAQRAAVLAAESSHVYSRAIHRALKSRCQINDWLDVETVPGEGIEVIWPGESTPTRLGSWRWLVSLDYALDGELSKLVGWIEDSGLSVVAIGWDGMVKGVFSIEEELRPSATTCLSTLRATGLDLSILTGDHGRRASKLSRELGIPATASLKPDGKSAEILRLRTHGHVVAMVGDGINDAPALSAADVGIALGCGTDVTRSSADICLLSDELSAIPTALDLAKETVATIRGNLAWSFGYNAIGVALAMAGWLHPSIAALLMVVSSGVVISRSVRVGRQSSPTSDQNPSSDEPHDDHFDSSSPGLSHEPVLIAEGVP